MPETKDKKLHTKNILSSSPNSRARSRNGNNNNNNSNNSLPLPQRPQATDFTAKQQLKIRAGDMRVARLQISLSKLRLEMEESTKLVEQLCHEARLDLKSEKKP